MQAWLRNKVLDTDSFEWTKALCTVHLQHTRVNQRELADALERCGRQRCCCACAHGWLEVEMQVLQGGVVSGLRCSQCGGERLGAGICQAPGILLQEWKLATV